MSGKWSNNCRHCIFWQMIMVMHFYLTNNLKTLQAIAKLGRLAERKRNDCRTNTVMATRSNWQDSRLGSVSYRSKAKPHSDQWVQTWSRNFSAFRWKFVSPNYCYNFTKISLCTKLLRAIRRSQCTLFKFGVKTQIQIVPSPKKFVARKRQNVSSLLAWHWRNQLWYPW